MRRRNFALLPGLVAVVVTIALLGQLPSDAGPDSVAAAGRPAQSDQTENEVPLSVRIASAPVEDLELPVVVGDNISLVAGPPKMAMRDEFAAAMQEAQIIHDRYAAAVSENVETADATEIWGYDRGEFEVAAGALFEELLAKFPDNFSGGVLHPVLPKVVVGFVDDSTALAEKIASSGFKYDFELREGLLTYQDRQELRNVVIAGEIGLVGDQYFADPITVAVSADNLVNRGETISQLLSEVADLPQKEIAPAFAELAATAPGESHLLLGPLAIELQFPGDGIVEEAISGVHDLR